MPERLVIRNTQSPGDYVVLTAAIRDLARAHPGRYEVMMDIPQPAIFQGSPYIKGFPKTPGIRQVVAKYPMIHKSNQLKWHFMWGFIDYLNTELRSNITLTEFKPDLHLTDVEKREPFAAIKKPYWVFVSGGKKDYTAKWWDPTWWQEVVMRLQGKTQIVQVGGGSHVHPKVNGVIDLVNKTSFRDLMRLIYHSEGVMCIVTCLMHIAAAFNKPCVVVAGGREPWWWEGYTQENRLINMRKGIPDWVPPSNDPFIPHQYLHTIGELDCCKTGGCWKSKIESGGNSCTRPVAQHGRKIPQCLQMITPDRVMQAIDWYYAQGILSWDANIKLILPPVITALPPPLPEEIAQDRPPTTADATVCVYRNAAADSADPEWDAFKHAISGSLPAGAPVRLFEDQGSRNIHLIQALYEAGSKWLVWVDYDARPELPSNWLDHVLKRVESSFPMAGGLVCWRPVAPAELTGILPEGQKNLSLEAVPTNPSRFKAYYFKPGLFIVPVQAIKDSGVLSRGVSGEWTDISLVEGLLRTGTQLIDIGDIIGYV